MGSLGLEDREIQDVAANLSGDVWAILSPRNSTPAKSGSIDTLLRGLDKLRDELNEVVVDNPAYVDAMIGAAADVYAAADQKEVSQLFMLQSYPAQENHLARDN